MTANGEEMLQQLNEAFYRMSYLRFDALGIRLDMSKLPSTKYVQKAFRAMHPKSRLRRLILRYRPRKRLQLFNTYTYWHNKQQAEFMNEVLDQGAAMVRRIDDAPPD